jgi:hypothetical protein
MDYTRYLIELNNIKKLTFMDRAKAAARKLLLFGALVLSSLAAYSFF